jgi:hypothetical protein
MRSTRNLIGLSILAVVGLGALVPMLDCLFTVNPARETESAFLKNYTPQSTTEQFQSKQIGPQWTINVKAAAGKQFASHQRDFHGQLAIDPQNWMVLMSSISTDLSTQLSHYGAQILAQSGDARDGFRFDYRLSKTLGSVVISPLKVVSVPSGVNENLAITLDIAIEEKHFRKEPSLITVSISSDSH